MRIALLTEGGYPYARGESVAWCDRLVRGLSSHDFELYALSRGRRQEQAGWLGPGALPAQVRRVRTAPLWGPPLSAASRRRPRQGRAESAEAGRRFAHHFGELAAALCAPPDREAPASGSAPAGGGERPRDAEADRFTTGLYGLADLAALHGGLPAALGSEEAVRLLAAACRAPGAPRAVREAQLAELLVVLERLERALRPLSLDWYGRPGAPAAAEGDPGLAGVDLCHAVGGGPAALPGLLAKRFFGTPLLLTEYGVRLREHYLAGLAGSAGARAGGFVPPPGAGAAVRTLLASFQRRLAAEAYRQAEVITPGNAHARGWQERCGADPRRLRTVYPGMDAAGLLTVPEDGGADPADPVLVWVGRIEPAKDLVALLHAFAEVRAGRPDARLLLVETRPAGECGESGRYAAHCRATAARLFPAEGASGRSPVSFEELGGPVVPTRADAYAAGAVVVRSSVVEGFPLALVEAMFCARATVSTDAGAVCEVIGGTGLVVPPRNPGALADACLALLNDPARRARLGAAARARARELFTVEQNVAAFHGIYLELISRGPARAAGRDAAREAAREAGRDGGRRGGRVVQPFARPPEAQIAARLADGPTATRSGPLRPSWAEPAPAGAHGREYGG